MVLRNMKIIKNSAVTRVPSKSNKHFDRQRIT